MDGVIADTAPFHFMAWEKQALERGIDFSEDAFRRTFGKRNPEIIAEIFDRNITTEEIKAIISEKEDAFRDIAQGNIRIFPGVLELLRTVKGSGWLTAIASSTPIDNITLIIQALNIADYFDTIVSDGDVSHGKPDPEVFLVAASRLDTAPNQCVVIEDAVADVQAAKSAGMACIAVTNTHPAERLSAADIVVENLEGITLHKLEALL